MKWSRLLKRPICFFLAVFMFISGFLPQLMLNVNAQTATTLPDVSGKIKLDQDPDGGYEGDYVLIQNIGGAYSVESTGMLTELDVGRSLFSENDDTGFNRIDYHPESVVPDGSIAQRRSRAAANDYNVDDKVIFNVQDLMSGQYQKKTFKLLTEKDHCYIWVPEGQEEDIKVTPAMGESISTAFESGYGQMTTSFGNPLDADNTGKVSLLLYDINCGNNPGSYVGGYFASMDLYGDTPVRANVLDSGSDVLDSGNENLPEDEPLDSGYVRLKSGRSGRGGSVGNSTAMIHIDTYPSIYPDRGGNAYVEEAYSTLVHEFQHLINYSDYYKKYTANPGSIKAMDAWLNEAMSMSAEEMVFPGLVFQIL